MKGEPKKPRTIGRRPGQGNSRLRPGRAIERSSQGLSNEWLNGSLADHAGATYVSPLQDNPFSVRS